MARVVFCHGIGYAFRHREDMHEDWYDALRKGMHDTGLTPLEKHEVQAVYYGNCFRSGTAKSGGVDDEFAAIPAYGPRSLNPLEIELMESFATGIEEPEGRKGIFQDNIRKLLNSQILGKVPDKVIFALVKQVRRYLTEEELRESVLERWTSTITEETRVVVGHSLGSVVAYEAVRAHPEWQIDTLITLGSPLGLNMIASRLRPPVPSDTENPWPGVRRWVNIAAKEDPIALVKELAPLYGERVEDPPPVSNGRFAAHSVLRYLTTQEVAKGIANGLGHH